MDLTPFVDNVRRELALAAEAGGEQARALAERLTAPLTSALRLTLLEALSAAADEITRDLAPGSVEVRLRRGEAAFAVTLPATHAPAVPVAEPDTPEPDEPAPADDDSAMVRINLRLPEPLKARIEEAAAAQSRSVNAWLVRAASTALQPSARPDPSRLATGGRGAQRYTGWVG